MRNDEQGRMTQHARGLGTVTRGMVMKRARELALINGRAEGVLPSDFDQAKRELTGQGEISEEPEAPRRRSHAEARETIRGTRGRQARSIPANDEQTEAEKLVQEGVEEAEHDQMVEGTRESLRRDQNTE